jgi:hypothetical protein
MKKVYNRYVLCTTTSLLVFYYTHTHMSTDFSKFSKEGINEVANKLKDSQARNFQVDSSSSSSSSSTLSSSTTSSSSSSEN